MTLGHRLKKARKRAGLTQERLAELAAVSCSYICEIERDRKVPSLDVFAALCTVLDTDAGVLLFGERRTERGADAIRQVLTGCSKEETEFLLGIVEQMRAFLHREDDAA